MSAGGADRSSLKCEAVAVVPDGSVGMRALGSPSLEDREDRVVRDGRECRGGLEGLLALLGRGLGLPQSERAMRDVFEEGLRGLCPAHTVYLRRLVLGGSRRRHRPEILAFDVPSADPHANAVLECSPAAGGPVTDTEVTLLRSAAQVAGLVLEIDRVRRRIAATVSAKFGRERRDGSAPLIGSTEEIARLRSKIERVAQTHFTVLIEGESGVGKELVARQIHDQSPRRYGPFVAVNCAAIVETLVEAELFGIEDRTATGVRGRRGKFEYADGGTLFLDEISDLSLAAQAKLLRAIQELAVERVGGHGSQRVDVRIVAATNRTLASLVEARLFRPDLYYRLSGVDVLVPPLRERRSDILELARYFLDRHRSLRPMRLSRAASEALVAYDWPGNVRELQRLIERAVALVDGDVVELDDLPLGVRRGYTENLGPSLSRNETLRAWGARYARLVLDRCEGNKREACRVLDISYHTLVSYLRYSDPAATPDENRDVAADALTDGAPDRSEHSNPLPC
jgi:transcriptional regulator with PAS, ATPase and Fis domain